MRREDFEHVIAAAANVLGEDEFVVIGSQAILGSVREPPTELVASMEADLFAHVVGPQTAKAPAGWMRRLVRVDIPPRVASARRAVAWCMEPHDLVLAKLARGSARDHEYAAAAIAGGLVEREVLIERAATLPLPDAQIDSIIAGLRR